MTERNFGWRKTALYSLLPLVVLAAAVESAARLWEFWHPPIPVDVGLSFTEDSRLFVPDPDRPGWMITHPNKAVAVGATPGMPESVVRDLPTQPFRREAFQLPKPEGVFRVFFLGGSSVNIAYNPIKQIASELRREQSEFREIEIVNCGGSTYGTHRLVPICNEILNYDPDAVLIYSGHNEFNEQEQLRLANMKTVWLQRLLWNSAALRLVRDRLAMAEVSDAIEEHNRRIIAQEPTGWDYWKEEIPQAELDERMVRFQRNLETMVRRCQQSSVPVAIGTVPSNLVKPQVFPPRDAEYREEVLALYKAGEYEQAREAGYAFLSRMARGQSSDAENRAIRAVARETGIPLADVEAAVIEAEPNGVPGEELFQDHCHLNDRGNYILTRVYKAVLERMLRNGD